MGVGASIAGMTAVLMREVLSGERVNLILGSVDTLLYCRVSTLVCRKFLLELVSYPRAVWRVQPLPRSIKSALDQTGIPRQACANIPPSDDIFERHEG